MINIMISQLTIKFLENKILNETALTERSFYK